MRSLFILLVLTLAACASSGPRSDSPADMPPNRLDPAMQIALRTAPADSVMGATVSTRGDLTDEQRAEVEATGAAIQSVVGPFFTVRATPPQIRAVAVLPFVLLVEGGRGYSAR